jgi:DNA-binding NtrC family response regulator
MHRPSAVLIASRFARLAGGRHLDLATGADVWLHRAVVPAEQRAVLFAAGARLCGLWHSEMAPYLDCGLLGEHEWFDVVAPGQAIPRVAARAARSSIQRFLDAQELPEVTISDNPLGGFAPTLRREHDDEGVRRSYSRALAGFGIRLVHRPVVDRICEWLREPLDPGPHVWGVDAPPGCGWRSCWRALAREARHHGFVPVDADLLSKAVQAPGAEARPWLTWFQEHNLLIAHHTDTWRMDDRRRLAALVLVLGGLRARSSVVLDVVRTGRTQPAAFQVTPVDPRELVAATWIDGCGPFGTDGLLEIATATGGWPGRFAAAVSQLLSTTTSSRIFAVHERDSAAGTYRQPLNATMLDRVTRDTDATDREALVCRAKGRRDRATRRRQTREIWAVWSTVDVPRTDRPHVRPAADAWRQAWCHLARTDEIGGAIDAALLLASAWIDDLALREAEALLRGALAAARIGRIRAPDAATVLYGETLLWCGRWAESRAMLDGVAGPRAQLVRARVAVATNDVEAALQQTAAALSSTRDGPEVAIAARAIRLHVAARTGDLVEAARGANELQTIVPEIGSRAAAEQLLALAEWRTAVRQPWPAALHTRVVALTAPAMPRLWRARARIALALARGIVPRRLEPQVRRVAWATGARALLTDDSPRPPWPIQTRRRSPMTHDIVSILHACHQDEEPASATTRVADVIRQRTAAAGVLIGSVEASGLVVRARTGRGPDPVVAERAAALGSRVGPERVGDDWQSAWPIVRGGSLVGVIAGHWPGRPGPPPREAESLVEMAAAAMAPLVESLQAPVPVRASGPASSVELIGSSEAMSRVRQAIDRAAPAPFPVLIEGESGAGKEVIARAIHVRSPRRARAFCAMNCAALTDDLFEAELFGHARGAFTGAVAERSGLFEEADGGTLFLDEVSELSARAQAKLLRALQEGEIRRLGETRTRRVDVRVVAATNRPLAAAAASGQFRADLRFRLDVIRIEVPPLRSRPEDIRELALHFWERAAARVGSRATLGADALGALARYDWPGNVRELQNVLAALAVAAPRRGSLAASQLPAAFGHSATDRSLTLDEARRRFETGFVRAALARAGGSRTRAAADLGLTRQGLSKLLDRLQLVSGEGDASL